MTAMTPSAKSLSASTSAVIENGTPCVLSVALMRTLGLWDGRTVYAILMAAAFSRPSSVTLSSRITNFWTLPVTVMGKASTKRT